MSTDISNSSSTPTLPPKPIRVALLQPALPKYRLPIFRELSSRPEIDLQLFYASDEPVKNVEPVGIRATQISSQVICKRPRLLWRQTHFDVIDPSRFDVVIAGWNTRYLSLVPALLYAKYKKIPFILWGHGYSKQETFARRFFRDWVGNLAAALMFYGHSGRKRFVERHGNEGRTFVALNTLDQSEIQNARKKILSEPGFLDQFKRENDLTQGPVLLFVSRLVHDNRTDLLLAAAKDLIPSFPKLRIVIIGAGEMEQKLRALAQELGVDKHTIFTGAIFEEEKIAPWFLSSSLFVYPSNVGLSLLHSMGYSLPVITTDNTSTWAPEVDALKPWLNGMTFRHNNAQDLAAVIKYLLSNPERLQMMRESAFRTATVEHTLQGMVDAIMSAIHYAYESVRKPGR